MNALIERTMPAVMPMTLPETTESQAMVQGPYPIASVKSSEAPQMFI